MKKTDFLFIFVLILIFGSPVLFDPVYQFYLNNTVKHPLIMSFIKFGLLATMGEMLGLRVKEGVYSKTGFGVFPRMIVWGFLGIAIFFAFRIFAVGVPSLLSSLNLFDSTNIIENKFSLQKLLTSFSISVFLNFIFAPIMMTFHKITDTHILQNNGLISALIKPINFAKILQNIDWNIQYNFVFKKTIPMFWIPAHTITFLLPAEFQVLFAAILGVILGLILSIASLKQKVVLTK